jgi:Glyoxalase-like domain
MSTIIGNICIDTNDLAGEVDRIRALGATEVRRFDGWVVLADSGGNQFCAVAAWTQSTTPDTGSRHYGRDRYGLRAKRDHHRCRPRGRVGDHQ